MGNLDFGSAPQEGISKATQNRAVLAELRWNHIVNAHDLLLRHGISRAAARIWDLRQQGYNIVTIRNGRGRMASYRLLDPEAQKDQEAADRWLARPIR